ncbi:thymidine kinase 2, mitochondrial-like [Pollicipes pollicipes]|uniref:thymidine kinase 2, mitochondrial-like n=1 Tax=Pollicipes pollicipes TaxID=41117 RepID=UPI0018855DCE|nr:thymidine kinase 2, mitochondrial-like [Pollicipes pollicipes]
MNKNLTNLATTEPLRVTFVSRHDRPTDWHHARPGRYCFVENLYQNGLMSAPEYAVLDQWFQWITTNVDVKPDLIVYLRSSPEVVAERIRRRARDEERAIPDSYLRALHELHEDWLVRRCRFSLPCSVLVLDADKDLQMLKEEFNSRKHEILCCSAVKSPVKGPRSPTPAAAI